jgi:hypothetical protein
VFCANKILVACSKTKLHGEPDNQDSSLGKCMPSLAQWDRVLRIHARFADRHKDARLAAVVHDSGERSKDEKPKRKEMSILSMRGILSLLHDCLSGLPNA